jgi:transposase InsO family protein
MTSRDDNLLNIQELCRVAGVSRSGYYNWIAAEPYRIECEEQDKRDFEKILEAFNHRGYDKGVKGIHMGLLHVGIVMNVKKVRRLMRKFGLKCKIRRANPYRRMMRALDECAAVPNEVNREFETYGARKILLTDITYLKRGDGMFSYLCTFIDACTKEILGYALQESLEMDFVLEAANKMIEKHQIEFSAKTILHSDQGTHYKAKKLKEILDNAELRRSMSRKANCWDNAPQESFFGHMKDEINLKNCQTHEEVCVVIDDWIDYYNNERYQWDLCKLAPREYYEFITSGKYPLNVKNPPAVPKFADIVGIITINA